jgi:hypothetical protein
MDIGHVILLGILAVMVTAMMISDYLESRKDKQGATSNPGKGASTTNIPDEYSLAYDLVKHRMTRHEFREKMFNIMLSENRKRELFQQSLGQYRPPSNPNGQSYNTGGSRWQGHSSGSGNILPDAVVAGVVAGSIIASSDDINDYSGGSGGGE